YQAAVARPGEEGPDDGQSPIARRRRLWRGDKGLQVPDRDLGDRLPAELSIQTPDMGQERTRGAAARPALPPHDGTTPGVPEPRGDRGLNRFAESSLASLFPLGPALMLRIVTGGRATAHDGGETTRLSEPDRRVLSDPIAPRLGLEDVTNKPDQSPAPYAQHKTALLGVDPFNVVR